MSTTYAANFQREREVNATRIKDTLYIFNGTYPVYYKGDGKLYLFPEHQTTYEELVVAGHNTMMDDFNSYYYPPDFKDLERPSKGQFTIKDFDFYPKVPFQFKSENINEDQLNIRLTYNYEDVFDDNVVSLLPNNYFGPVTTLIAPTSQGYSDLVGKVVYFEGTENFYTPDPLNESPDPLGRVPEGWKIVNPTEANGFKKYYEASVKVYTRPTTFAGTSEWIEIDNLNVDADVLGNKPFFIEEFRGIETPYNVQQNTKYFNATSYLDVTVNNITAGLRDIKVEVTVAEIGFAKDTSVVSSPYAFFPVRILNKVYKKEEIELESLNILPERLQDFPLDIPGVTSRGGFTLRAPWTCNQVIEHYGKLIIWGSEDMPYTAFVSAVDNYNYFPYNYTIDFNTDLKEPINSIVPFMNILVVQSDSYTWGIKGNTPQITIDDAGEEVNPNAYQVITINASVGSIAPKAVRPVRNRLYFLSQEGLMELTSLFATDDRYNVKPIDRNIWNLIPQDKNAVAIQFDNQYWIHFPYTGQTFRYYIDKQAWVKDSFNFDTFNGIYRYYNKNGKLHFITNPMVIESGNLEIYEGVIDYSLATDFDRPIQSQFLTSKMNQEYPFHWKRYKELKLDFTVQNEYMPNKEPVNVTQSFDSNFEETYEIQTTLSGVVGTGVENRVAKSNSFNVTQDNDYTLTINGSVYIEDGVLDPNGYYEQAFIDPQNPTIIRFQNGDPILDPTTFEVFSIFDLGTQLEFSIQKGANANYANSVEEGHLFNFSKEVLASTTYSYEHDISSDLQKKHTYEIQYPFGVFLSEPEEGDEYDNYYIIKDLQVYLNQPNQSLFPTVSPNGGIRFLVPNTGITSEDTIIVKFNSDDDFQNEFDDATITDDTYDAGLNYNIRVMADNNTMIRDDFKSYVPIEKNINTGSVFSNITFGSTNFGDVTTFVQTTKLYGNGYDINVYYRDESNIKWTLETMGITYKMRRTRSDRRG